MNSNNNLLINKICLYNNTNNTYNSNNSNNSNNSQEIILFRER